MLPAVSTALTKTGVLALTPREDVEAIYLVEGKPVPGMDSAVHTNRVGPLWRGLGVKGVEQPQLPVTIAIVEQGNVELSDTYLRVPLRRVVAPNPDQPEHMTMVASAAASFHPVYRGMAPGAMIISAGHSGSATDLYTALNWALDQSDPQPGAPDETVRIANVSEAWNGWPAYTWVARTFDYAARARSATITAAAGNDVTLAVTSPAAGWNVVGVGGINDRSTTNWSDDSMYRVAGTNRGSSYLNPVNGNEKPEVVAPGQDIEILGPTNQLYVDQEGTSLAAPQVAGLAALLMLRNQEIRQYPTAMKAILMASAVHNIEGDSRLSDQDGAGSIDAALADAIVGARSPYESGCATPCWWSIATASNFPSPGQALVPSPGDGHSFAAARGERIRVAVAWWSEADPPPVYPYLSGDALNSNFDLRIWSPTTQFVAASESQYDNFEIVDFVAGETGWYRLEVIKNPNGTTEDSNVVGIAWVKDATYLTDLRNQDGWASEFYVRNDGAEPRNVTIHYFDANGTPTPKVFDECSLMPNQYCSIPVDEQNRIPAGTTGSATVGASQDVAVVVETKKADAKALNTYSGIAPEGTTANVGWGQTGSTIYVPWIRHNHFGRTSRLYILNAGTSTATVNATAYQGDTPYTLFSDQQIAPNALYTHRTTQIPSGNDSGKAAAVIECTNGQPLAVIVEEEEHNYPYTTAQIVNAYNQGDDLLYAPFVKNDQWGNFTHLRVQNLDDFWWELVNVDYYSDNGFTYNKSASIGPNASVTFSSLDLPSTFQQGSAVVSEDSHRPMAMFINESGYRGSSAFLSANGTSTVILPRILWNWQDGGYSFSSAVRVQNLGTETTTVALQYYYPSGTALPNPPTRSIDPNKSASFWSDPPPNGEWSAVATSSNGQPIVAAVNLRNNNTPKEFSGNYNGFNR